MEPGSTPVFISLFGLLLMSAFFSISETALTSLPHIRLMNMLDEGVKGAVRLNKLMSNDKFLTTILIGNNFVNILASSIATSLVIRVSGDSSAVLAATTFGLTLIILIFGEITPKTIAVNYSEKISLLVAPPIYYLTIVLTPLSAVLSFFAKKVIKLMAGGKFPKAPAITESELKTMVNVGLQEGVIDTGEKNMLHNVFELGQSDAKDVMTPRTDLAALPIDATRDEVINLFKEEQFTRMPVYRNNIDHIVGILNFKDFVFSDTSKPFKLEDYIREPFFSYESKLASTLFTEMRSQNIPLAIILDEYGGTSGIVTLEDLLECIVGEIYDEYDEDHDEEIKLVDSSKQIYISDGSARLSDLNRLAGSSFESDDYDTVGGYVLGLLGQIPSVGDVALSDGVKFIVEETSKNRIEKLRIIFH